MPHYKARCIVEFDVIASNPRDARRFVDESIAEQILTLEDAAVVLEVVDDASEGEDA